MIGDEQLYSDKTERMEVPSLAEIKMNFVLFLPFILSFLLLMEQLFFLNRQQTENFLGAGILAIFFSVSTIATYCMPRFKHYYVASAPAAATIIGLLIFWKWLSVSLGI